MCKGGWKWEEMAGDGCRKRRMEDGKDGRGEGRMRRRMEEGKEGGGGGWRSRKINEQDE